MDKKSNRATTCDQHTFSSDRSEEKLSARSEEKLSALAFLTVNL